MHREDEEAKEVYRKRHGQQEGRGEAGNANNTVERRAQRKDVLWV